jgi:phage-related protein
MAGQTVIVSILADTKRFDAGLNKASSSLRNFSNGISKFSRNITVGVGLAALAFGKFVQSSVLSAAELEQLLGGAEVVYGDFFGNIEKYSADAYKRMGLAQNDYLKASTVLGVLLQDTTFKGEKLTGTVDALAMSASDLASLVGGTTEEALLAFQSAIKGNFQILDNFGIKMTAAEVSQRALLDTGKKSVTQLTEQEKVQARVNLLLEKSAFAAGNFAKESGTFAGSLQILNARWANFLNDVGGPIVAKLESQNVFGKLTDEINKFVQSPAFDVFIKDLGDAIVELAKNAPKFAKALTEAFSWAIENKQQLAQFTATVIALGPALRVITWLAQPFVWVAAGIGAVVAAFKTFQKVVKPTVITAITRKVVLWNKEWANTDNVFSKAWRRFAIVSEYIKEIGKNIDKFAGKTRVVARLSQFFFQLAKPILYLVGLFRDFQGQGGSLLGILRSLAGPLSKVGGFLSKAIGPLFAVGSKFLGWITVAFYGLQPIFAYLINAWQGMWYLMSRSFESFSMVVSDIWLIVSTLFGRIVGAIGQWFSDISAAVGQWFTDLGAWFAETPVGQWVMGFVEQLGVAWQTVVDWWNSTAMEPFRNFLEGVWEALTDPFWLYKISDDFFSGLLEGFKANVDRIFDWFDNLWADIIDGAKEALGIASPSKVMKAIGKNIGQGLAIGIDATQSLVTKASDGLYNSTLGGFDTPFSPTLAGAGGGSGAVYNVTVNALQPSAEVGRAVVKSIKDYERTGGTR